MKKENIVICENCGRNFNNYYTNKGKYRKFACSRECGKILRLKATFLKNKERRHQLRKEHRCIVCKIKVKPVISYHQFCPKHKPKSKQKKK